MKQVKNSEISPQKKHKKNIQFLTKKNLYNYLLIIKNPHLLNIQLPRFSIKFKFEV